MIVVIVCKGNADHEEDRKNHKYKNSKSRKRQQGHMELGVQKLIQILLHGRNLLPFLQALLFIAVLPHVHKPDQNEEKSKYNSQKTPQQNQKAVVPVHRQKSRRIHVGLNGSQRGKFRQIPCAKGYHIPYVQYLNGQKRDTSQIIPSHQRAESQDQKGNLCLPVTFLKRESCLF